jgi:dihydropteroate synthase
MDLQILSIDKIEDMNEEMKKIGVDREGISIMAPKSLNLNIKIPKINLKAALILKQEMLSLGGDAALPREAFNLSKEITSVILLGNLKIFNRLVEKLKTQYFQLPELSQKIKEVIVNYHRRDFLLKFKDYQLNLNRRTHIMGILNVTPDSFYDGGRYLEVEKAVEKALSMVEEGADIIDIGGRSTRPGSKEINLEEELRRVIPVIERLAPNINVPISIDTYRAKVAERAILAGAAMINDISGLNFDSDMAKVASKYQVPIVLMHIKGTPEDMQRNPVYQDLILEIINYLREAIRKALENNIDEEMIIIDPGIGFGKTLSHNLEIIRRLEEFKVLGRPILIGVSRKSFIGKILNLDVEERLEGTSSSVALSILNGACIVRVHDVKEMKRVAMVADAIKNKMF